MTEQLITSATAYRKKRGAIEWLVVKKEEKGWAFPKGVVRKGESSVGAILRILREDMGLTVEVLEESGRATSNSNRNGEKIAEKILYYLIEETGPVARKSETEKWCQYAVARTSLNTEREKRMLMQARDTLKECLKKRN